MRLKNILKEAFIGAVLLSVIAVAIMGCASQPKVCNKCDYTQQRIKEAEQWMSNNVMKLVYPGDWSQAFEIEYNSHHKWIVVRDAYNTEK